MDPESDIYYIDRVNKGDRESFRWIVEAYKEMVYTICLRMLSNETDAEEAAQEIFVKVFRTLGSFHGNSKFSTWLYRVSYNHCISVIRRKVKMIDLVDEVPDSVINDKPVDGILELEKEERAKHIRNALEALPETDSVIITLFYYEELSIEEIAGITGLTNNNIRIRLHRARKKLYEVLSMQLRSELESIR